MTENHACILCLGRCGTGADRPLPQRQTGLVSFGPKANGTAWIQTAPGILSNSSNGFGYRRPGGIPYIISSYMPPMPS
jgi:hypothetical protein